LSQLIPVFILESSRSRFLVDATNKVSPHEKNEYIEFRDFQSASRVYVLIRLIRGSREGFEVCANDPRIQRNLWNMCNCKWCEDTEKSLKYVQLFSQGFANFASFVHPA